MAPPAAPTACLPIGDRRPKSMKSGASENSGPRAVWQCRAALMIVLALKAIAAAGWCGCGWMGWVGVWDGWRALRPSEFRARCQQQAPRSARRQSTRTAWRGKGRTRARGRCECRTRVLAPGVSTLLCKCPTCRRIADTLFLLMGSLACWADPFPVRISTDPYRPSWGC